MSRRNTPRCPHCQARYLKRNTETLLSFALGFVFVCMRCRAMWRFDDWRGSDDRGNRDGGGR